MVGKIQSEQSANELSTFQISGIDKTGSKKASKTINASGFSHALDPNAKLEKARKQAMNFIRDALAGVVNVDKDLASRNDHIKELAAIKSNAECTLDRINSDLASLREEYGIAPDSIEEKELNFLVAADKVRAASPGGQLNAEMQAKVDEVMSHLIDYQKKALPLRLERESETKILSDSERDLMIEEMTVRSTKIERLKSNPMGEAWDNANALMKAAYNDLVSSAFAEAKENIEEELEEKVEEAKEAADKEEELEERIEDTKEEKKEQEKITEEILDAVQKKNIASLDMSEPGSEINELMNKLKLIEFDVKGAVVDEKL